MILSTEGTVGQDPTWLVLPEEVRPYFFAAIDVEGQHKGIFAYNKPVKVTFVLAVAENNEVALAFHILKQGKIVDPDPDDPDPDDPDPIPGGSVF